MRDSFIAGECFLTACEFTFEGIAQEVFIVPSDTMMYIVEVDEEEIPFYKVSFEGIGSEENWTRMSAVEIDELRQSAMAEY